MPGRGVDVTDREILRAASDIDGPVFTSTELAVRLPIKSNQVNKRLEALREQGYVDRKRIGSGKAWWLTEKGRSFIAE